MRCRLASDGSNSLAPLRNEDALAQCGQGQSQSVRSTRREQRFVMKRAAGMSVVLAKR